MSYLVIFIIYFYVYMGFLQCSSCDHVNLKITGYDKLLRRIVSVTVVNDLLLNM